MGIFRQFPYSNFHDMNMDELIKIVKELQDAWNETKTEWTSYKDFIDNYFNNLDLDDEVLSALRIMAEDGSLNTVIDPVIVDEVRNWLQRYVTPTSPAVDSSLLVPGAAADAYETGYRIRNNAAMIAENTNDISVLENYVEILKDKKVNQPLVNGQVDNGNAGQILSTRGDGTTDWVDIGTPTDEQIQAAIEEWLNDHPEATTTVLDDSLTIEKAVPALREKLLASMLVNRLDPYLIPFIESNTSNSQGMCVAGDYLIYTALDGDDTTYHVMDIQGKNVLSHATFQTGHSNCLTFDPVNSDVLVVDYSTLYRIHLNGYVLESISSVDLAPESFTAISKSGDTYYLRQTNTQKIFSTTDFKTYTEIMTVTYGELANPTPQGLCVNYPLLFAPASMSDTDVELIFVYNLETTNLIHVYEFSQTAYGELEDVDIYNGNIVFNFNSSAKNIYMTPVFTNAHLVHDNRLKHISDRALSYFVTDIYVDNSVTYSFVDGTAANPFVNLNEALVFVERMNINANVIIRGTYPASLGIEGYHGRGRFTLDNANIAIFSIIDSDIKISGTGTIKRIVAQRSLLEIQGANIALNGNGETVVAIFGYRSIITGDLSRVSNYGDQPIINGQGAYINIFVANTDDLRTLVNTSMSIIRHNSITINGNVLRDGVAIANDADLNDLTAPGITYRCSTDAIAASLTNCPTNLLFVLNTYQRSDTAIFQQLVDKNGDIYSRYWSSGTTWSAWKVCRSVAV